MQTIGKTVTAAAMAVALLVAGAIAFGPTADEPAGDLVGRSVSNRSSSALLAPVVSTASLDGTIASLQDRLRAVPDDWRSSASLGLAYVAQARVTGDPSWYPKAEGILARSLGVNADDNVEGLLGQGMLDLARHDFPAALRRGRRAAALDPHGAEAYGVIGDALLELGRYDRAFEAFQTMVDTRPDLSSYARVAYARELVGDVKGAERAMRMAFDNARGHELDPSYVPNLAGLAKVAWARGDDLLAVERFSDAVSRYPSAEFVAALADLYRATGRPALAEQQEDVVRAMHELASESGVNVDLELALFDADHGHPARALEAARAEWGRRHGVHVADAYAWALYTNGRYARASALSERALALGTRNALFLFHAGMIRLELGDERGAARYLSAALATNPNFSIQHADAAAMTLQRLEAGR
jgi:tetratricopeptide (TPR) repeat protein